VNLNGDVQVDQGALIEWVRMTTSACWQNVLYPPFGNNEITSVLKAQDNFTHEYRMHE